ncbi:MAG TPA: folylpolyglutamate synthase/dihydrofolate synthase family protein [Alphaproteobacteria bacterium]|nr:folylpolyglutamate synthase/dihydrofolate synthase family protein [Alphaproteobacteria bacterium]
MAETSSQILARLHTYHALPIDLSLREGYFRVLERLGNPHLKLPPVIHVAGTNGKGSTIAFMRAMLEAEGLKVHAYTSPHLVRFHERIRLAGKLIEENFLVELLKECEAANAAGQVTFFELTTALAFLAFARVPADVALLETGMGGRLDATNVIQNPLATVITLISHDHGEYLGHGLDQIAGEKAGIFKQNAPAVIALQTSKAALQKLEEKAAALGVPLFAHGRDWNYQTDESGFTFSSTSFTEHFPNPVLPGAHQYANAAAAIATLKKSGITVSTESMQQGLQKAEWPARLQRLHHGPLASMLPKNSELWLDGGHNDSAGLALAAQATRWNKEDGKPLFVIYGMLASKQPEEFLQPLAPHIRALAAVAIPEEGKSLSAQQAAKAAEALAIKSNPCAGLAEAVDYCLKQAGNTPARILITGSLYLAGFVLRDNS